MTSRHVSPPGALRKRSGRHRALLMAAYSLLLLSCENPLAPEEEVVGRVDVSPATISMVVGETRPVTATVTSDGGQTLRDRRTYWSSLNPAIATVSQQGIVSAVAAGATQIAASAGGKSAIVAVTVTARPVAVVRVTPSATTVLVGGSVTLGAQAVDAAGGTITGRPVLWSTSSATVATVTSTGVVTGVSAGTATLTARIDDVSGTAVVTVQPVPVASLRVSPATGRIVVGEALQLTASPLDAAGNTLAGRIVTWGSSNLSIASVSSTGLVTALSPGNVTITATSEGRSATVAIAVTAIPVDTVAVSPASATVASGQTVQLSARLADARGNALSGRTVTWTSDQPTIASVSPTGEVTGVGTGAARITAASEGKTGTAVVTVTPVPIASLAITPPGGSLLIGNTLQLSAEARDAQGRPLPGRVITWITGAPTIVSISRTGLVTALAPGSAVVFAASEGISASVTITVSGIGVARVTVSPTSANITQGGQLQLSAEAFDAQGAPVAGRAATWSSSNDAVATVSSTGRVTGIATGVVTITVTVDGVSATASISVAAATVAAVQVTPGTVTVTPGQSQPFVISLTDALGRSLSSQGRVVTWSSSNPAVATINASGLATAIAAGTTAITATVDGVSGQATMTVAIAQVTSLSLVPATATVTVSGTVALTPLLSDALGNPLSTAGRVITYSALDPSIATVNATGIVTGVAVGSNARIVAATAGATGTVADTSRITVTSVPVASVVIAQGASASVSIGPVYKSAFSAQAFDASNNVLTGRTFTWTSTQQSIAQVDGASGVVTGIAPGTSLIIAVAEGKADTISVAVDYVPIASVAVALTPGTQADSVSVGQQRTFRVTPLDAANATISGLELGPRVPTWSIVASGGNASITAGNGTQNATVQASAAGTVNVQASYGTQASTNTAPLRILVPVANVIFSVTPADSIFSGATTSITAVAADAANQPIPGRRIDLASSSAVASLATTTGLASIASVITGVTPPTGRGSATLTATVPLDNVSATRSIIVLAPIATIAVSSADSILVGGTTAASAAVVDASGNSLTGRVITWQSSAPNVASVSAAGVVTGVAPGTATISATAEGQTGQTTVRVNEPVATVALSVARTGIRIGESLPSSVTLTGTLGGTLANRLVTYSSSNPAVATVNASGVITAVGVGTTNVTATSEGKTSPPLAITVTLAPVGSVTLSAPDSSIFVGQTVQAVVVARDTANIITTLTGRTVNWTSSAPSVATVATGSTGGLITAVAVGNSNIGVTVDGVGPSGAIPLSVSLIPVSSVAVVPSTANLFVSDNFTFQAELKDQNGNVLSQSGRVINWTTSSAAKAPISNAASGAVFAQDSGQVTITATSAAENVSGTATLTISLIPITSVAINPSSVTLASSTGTATLTVSVFHTSATRGTIPLAGRRCTSSPNRANMITVSPSSALTNAAGEIALTVTGIQSQPGSAPVVTTTCEGVSGTATVTVP